MSEPYLGEIRMFAGNFAPKNWAYCDGQLLPVKDNDALFSLLGDTYGGDGRITFGLPELRGRLALHFGQGPGLTKRVRGERMGTERVTLTTNNVPIHDHQFMADNVDQATDVALTGKTLAKTLADDQFYAPGREAPYMVDLIADAIQDAGGSQPHYNKMPYLCIHYIIALVGIYPSKT